MLGPVFDGFVDAFHDAGESTARILTGMYRDTARENGVPAHMLKSLRVSYHRPSMGFEYNLPRELAPVEYGDLSHPPTAFRRKAMAAHAERAKRLVDAMAAEHHNPAVL